MNETHFPYPGPFEELSHSERRLILTYRLQSLTAEVSSRFAFASPAKLDATIEGVQRLVCETLGLDRSTLWQASESDEGMSLTHIWQRNNPVELRRNFGASTVLPWTVDLITRGQVLCFSRLDDLPAEAADDARVFRIHGIRSNLTFPLFRDGMVFGALAFASLTREREWNGEEIAGLRLISQIIGEVVSRHRADERLDQLRREIELSARASAFGELAASLAHEISQPLTAILSNAEAARRFLDQPGCDAAEIRAILDDIIREDMRAADVIRSLRSMLSGLTQAQEIQPVHTLIHEVLELHAGELVSSGVEVRLDLAAAHPFALVTAPQFRLLLRNLVSNSIQAFDGTPPDKRLILIRTTADHDHVTIHLQDSGPGIPPQHLDRIFEPFHSTRKHGLGIGLAICRRIAESHGGEIRAANSESGAVFHVVLPLYDPVGAS